MADQPDVDPGAPPADPPLQLSQRAAWIGVVALVLAAVAAMLLVYWPGLQLRPPAP